MDHLRPILTRYFWVLLFSTVGATALGLLWLIGSGLPPPAILSTVPLGIAGYDAGREYARRNGRGPGRANGAKLSAILLVFTVALYLFIYVGASLGQGASLTVLFVGMSSLLLPILIVSALFYIMIFVMMWFGSRSVR